MRLYVPAGVPPPPFIPPPPLQEDNNIPSRDIHTKASPRIHQTGRRRVRPIEMQSGVSTTNQTSENQNAIKLPTGGKPNGVDKLDEELNPVATMTPTDVGEEPLSVTELGETLQVDDAGDPLQLNATVLLNPPPGVIAIV